MRKKDEDEGKIAGDEGPYPRKLEKMTQQLSNNVFLTRDGTFDQRQEARLFLAEKEQV